MSMLVSKVQVWALSACNIKICQNKGCVKNFPSKYDGGLPQTIADLTLPSSTSTSTTPTIETTGCLSQCQNGPNLQINDRVFGRVDDIGMTAAILEVGADMNMDGKEMGLLMAAVEGMAKAQQQSNNPDKAMTILTKVVDSLVNADTDVADLKQSTAMAHALILRADLRLEMFSTTLMLARSRSNQSVEVEEGEGDLDYTGIQFALEDALRAVEIDTLDGRGWRVVADAKEAMGDVLGAMDAVSKWATCNPSFVVKAKNEMDRLSHKASP